LQISGPLTENLPREVRSDMRCHNMSCHERTSGLFGQGVHEDRGGRSSKSSLDLQRYYSGMEQLCPAGCKWISTEIINDLSDFEPCWHHHCFREVQIGDQSWPTSCQDVVDLASAEGDLFDRLGDDETRLLSLVRCDPGETRAWLARVIGWTDSRTNLALDRLKRSKKVRIRRVGKMTCVYPEVQGQ